MKRVLYEQQKVGKSITTARNLVDLTFAVSGRVMGGMLMYTKLILKINQTW